MDRSGDLFDGLARLRRVALETFVDLPGDRDQNVSQIIEDYVRELRLNLELALAEHDHGDEELGEAQETARATCEATGDNIVTLLYKFEDYLESVLAGRLALGRVRPER